MPARPLVIDDLPPPPAGRTGWPWTEASQVRTDPRTPSVSLVTPSFNQAAFLEETIRSVLLQGYCNLQYIIIDGGSNDGSVSILEKYAPWLDFWTSEPDNGQSDAIRKGLTQATGDWCNWLNSDDTLKPNALHGLVELARSHPKADILAGRTENIRNGQSFGQYGVTLAQASPHCFFTLGVNQPGSLIRRTRLLQVGSLRNELHLSMDLDLWLRIMIPNGASAIAQTEKTVATYRYHDSSKTCSDDDVFALEEFVILHDLAVAAGSSLASKLTTLRQLSSLPTLRYPAPRALAVTDVDQAFARRLLVDDNLLFRALQRSGLTHQRVISKFSHLLEQMLPTAATLLGYSSERLEARALMQAQQSMGRLVPHLWWRALRCWPRPTILTDGLRLLRATRIRQHQPTEQT